MSSTNRRKFLRQGLITGVSAVAVGDAFSGTFSSCYLPTDELDLSTAGWPTIRELFYLDHARHYLNTASLGPSPKSVVEAMFNATIRHEQTSETYYGETTLVRENVAKFFNCTAPEIAITRNATESINIVARGLRLKKGDHVVMSKHEHVGGASPWMALQLEYGVEISLVDLDLTGENNFTALTSAITKKTKALFFSHVCCTTGMVLPVRKIADYCAPLGIVTCVDGAQAIGQVKVDFRDLEPDFYVSSGHKWLYGPKGTGILFVNERAKSRLKPTFVGAYSMSEYNLLEMKLSFLNDASREEYGTRNTALYHGIQAALDFANGIGTSRILARGPELVAVLNNELSSIERVEILSPQDPRYSSSMFCFRIRDIDYTEVQKKLSEDFNCRVRGIYENNLFAIRISCAIHVLEDDIAQLISGVKKIASA